jgi:hypothetical protein
VTSAVTVTAFASLFYGLRKFGELITQFLNILLTLGEFLFDAKVCALTVSALGINLLGEKTGDTAGQFHC